MFNKKLAISSAIISSTCFGLFSQSTLVCSVRKLAYPAQVQNFLKRFAENPNSFNKESIRYYIIDFCAKKNDIHTEKITKFLTFIGKNKNILFNGFTLFKDIEKNEEEPLIDEHRDFTGELDNEKVKDYSKKPHEEIELSLGSRAGNASRTSLDMTTMKNYAKIFKNIRDVFFSHLQNDNVPEDKWSQEAKKLYDLIGALKDINVKSIKEYMPWLMRINKRPSSGVSVEAKDDNRYILRIWPHYTRDKYLKEYIAFPPIANETDENKQGKWTFSWKYENGKFSGKNAEIYLDDDIGRWIIDTCQKKVSDAKKNEQAKQDNKTEEKNESLEKGDLNSALHKETFVNPDGISIKNIENKGKFKEKTLLGKKLGKSEFFKGYSQKNSEQALKKINTENQEQKNSTVFLNSFININFNISTQSKAK